MINLYLLKNKSNGKGYIVMSTLENGNELKTLMSAKNKKKSIYDDLKKFEFEVTTLMTFSDIEIKKAREEKKRLIQELKLYDRNSGYHPLKFRGRELTKEERSDIAKKAGLARCKPVICHDLKEDTKQEFSSTKEASEVLGIRKDVINKNLRKKILSVRKKRYVFTYKE